MYFRILQKKSDQLEFVSSLLYRSLILPVLVIDKYTRRRQTAMANNGVDAT